MAQGLPGNKQNRHCTPTPPRPDFLSLPVRLSVAEVPECPFGRYFMFLSRLRDHCARKQAGTAALGPWEVT